ncbi:MAG: hypothetical protein RMM98_15315, partial [Acidobacteriota bacterium]|nr:hypothetical protein [Acidobacteriota bacterium]
MAFDAALFFTADRHNSKTGKKESVINWLRHNEVGELIEIVTDPDRDGGVRAQILLGFFDYIKENKRRPISLAPFLRMVQDDRESFDLRLHVIELLEDLNVAEVRNGFRAILATEPKTEADRQVWERLRQSPLLAP